MQGIAILRSHGGRVRAIETGETKIDIAFIGAPSCDEYGNCRAVGGNSNCGVLSYSAIDAEYAEYVVVLTDCLVPFPNFPADISMTERGLCAKGGCYRRSGKNRYPVPPVP